ncbi:hypothetical protein QE152_g9519 [Popillia japonica]|uniref:Uncharacterized protein n=1 Tax=Popillia japonica TaxID=7064 RepID=A0AAW1LUT3_POPJA
MKISLVFIVIIVHILFVTAEESAPIVVDPEERCTEAGGVCAKGCLHSPYNAGLCPKQQKDGVECCYDPSDYECRKFGGECITDCPKKITFEHRCSSGKKCCIWMR